MPNVDEACARCFKPNSWFVQVDMAFARFETEGVDFVKKPNDGKMKGLAFIKVVRCFFHLCKRELELSQDPDGCWIEILSPHTMASAF